MAVLTGLLEAVLALEALVTRLALSGEALVELVRSSPAWSAAPAVGCRWGSLPAPADFLALYNWNDLLKNKKEERV